MILKDYLVLYMKAFCMGCADLIPGVSGGTIAFITGMYEDLLAAVASLNREFFKCVITFKWKRALEIAHWRFLAVVVFGMLTAIFSLARLMHYLINEHAIHTWSMFFGLIAASIIIVFKELEGPSKPKNLVPLIGGAIFAWFMVSLIPVETPADLWFIYICGIISISAMILPGLSGSFLLLILGKYEYITGAVKSPFVEGNFAILITFACGSLTGLLGFSKVLNYFLKNFRSETMAFLTGILIGSMKKVWPWKVVTNSVVIRGKTKILSEANIMPESINTHTMLAITYALLGFILIIVLESKASKNRVVKP